ncbi:MAG: hypothetical protein Q9181_003920 [Wetmoreana brouardii]
MDRLHETFYRVQHGDSYVTYDAENGFEAGSHYMEEPNCYYINKQTIETHLSPKTVLAAKLSPYISVFDDYSESNDLVEISGLRLANDVVDDALEHARSHCRQGCKEVIIAEIDTSALRLNVLDIEFPNQTVQVPMWQTTERDSFLSILDLRSVFEIDVSLGQESEWLALDYIPKHLITNIESRVVCGNVEPPLKIRKDGIASMLPPLKMTRKSEESSVKRPPLKWILPPLHYNSPYESRYISPYESPSNPEPGKASSRLPAAKRPAAPFPASQKPFSFLEVGEPSAKGPALGWMATPPPTQQKPSSTHEPKKARAKGSSWRPMTKEDGEYLDGIHDYPLRTKIKQMHASLRTNTLVEMRDALEKHKGNLYDAIRYLDPDYLDPEPAASATPSLSQWSTQQILPGNPSFGQLPAEAQDGAMQLLAAPPPAQQQPPSVPQVEEPSARARPLKRKAPRSPASPKPLDEPKAKKALYRRPALKQTAARSPVPPAPLKTPSDPEPGQAPAKAAVKKWIHDPKSTMQTQSPPSGSELNPVLLD